MLTVKEVIGTLSKPLSSSLSTLPQGKLISLSGKMGVWLYADNMQIVVI